MKRTNSVSILTLQTLCVVWLGTLGCSSSNTPAAQPPASAGGSASVGGSSSSTAGGSTAVTNTSAGGNAAGGSNAATGGANTATTGGSTATPGTSQYSPSCTGLTTVAGAAIAKGTICAATDPQLCYKTCGPENLGFKSETCASGAYAEEASGPPCHFPATDYSCYKVPTSDGPGCPATPPQHGDVCTIGPCIVCGFTGGYLSSGTPKTGFCVCVQNADPTKQKWSCATYPVAWPCGPNMSAGSTGC